MPNWLARCSIDLSRWHDVGKVFVQIFDVALKAWLGDRAGLCIFEPTYGQGLALEYNGVSFSCDHYVEPNFRLGNQYP